MKKAKSSISKARSYSEIGEFWDENDSSDFWKKTRRVKFDVVLAPETTYYPMKRNYTRKFSRRHANKGVSSETLVIYGWSRKSKNRNLGGVPA